MGLPHGGAHKDCLLLLRWALVALPLALLLLLREQVAAPLPAPPAAPVPPPPLPGPLVPSCGSPAQGGGARWRGAQRLARHAIVFGGRASDMSMARVSSVVDFFGGPGAVDAFAILGYRESAAAVAEAALEAFAAHPAAVAAALFLQPHPALTPEALAAMPSFSYGTYDVPYFSPHDTAMIHTGMLRGWRLLECAERAANHTYSMVVRARGDLLITPREGSAAAVDLDAFAARAHPELEERLDGPHSLEGIIHSDNLRDTQLAAGGGDALLHLPPGAPTLPLYLPKKWNYDAYGTQLAWGTRETMGLYLTTLLHVEETCARRNVTYAEETTLMGGMVLRAFERGKLISVHYVGVEYCIRSKLNPCPGDPT